MVLSKENYDKLNESFLYAHKPVSEKREPYWCRNWTFVVKKVDGRAWMYDTYWGISGENNYFEVTDENIDEYQIIFDFNEVVRVNDSEIDEYEYDDLFRAATDSGGYSCGKLFWRKKTTQKSKPRQIEKTEYKIQCLKRDLEKAEKDLERLKSEI